MADQEIQQAEQTPVTRTVRVIVRHSADCKDKDKGEDWQKCNCPKSVRIYEGAGSGKNRRISAKTRTWSRAEEFAKEIRDGWDPVKNELKRLKAEQEKKFVRIEDAVALYIQDMAARLGDNGTCSMARALLGNVDPETKAVIKNGHLFDWLDSRPIKVQFISEITPAMLTAWRASWNFGDMTAAQRWGMVRSFFAYCERSGWVESDPARGIRRPKVAKGNRTATFTDEQVASIIDAVQLYDPENRSDATTALWRARLEAFILLLRWSGMAMVDAIQFRTDMIDDAGVLRYRRTKTKELAVVPLPDHVQHGCCVTPVVSMLREVPAEKDTADASQPFRNKATLQMDAKRWTNRLDAIFKLAGIAEVRTEGGRVRKPHPHMFRDTFAVWHLRHGAGIHTVSKMLGHGAITTTERAYLPFIQELQDSMIADARKSLAHAAVLPSSKKA